MEEEVDLPNKSSSLKNQSKTDSTTNDAEYVVNIELPEKLLKIIPACEFVNTRHRWNTNEEIASLLIAFDKHKEWLVYPQKIRPTSGSMLLYNRKKVFYRRDGYCWKKRKNGITIREDHMKLKVQGLECIYGSYVHSAILPTFHRRCYFLLQNPNIVLLHYLNVPYPESAKPAIPSLSYELKRKDWSKEELVDQLRPMLSGVSENTEQEAVEDQKVEKNIEELLAVLLPISDSNSNPKQTVISPSLKRPISLCQADVQSISEAQHSSNFMNSLHSSGIVQSTTKQVLSFPPQDKHIKASQSKQTQKQIRPKTAISDIITSAIVNVPHVNALPVQTQPVPTSMFTHVTPFSLATSSFPHPSQAVSAQSTTLVSPNVNAVNIRLASSTCDIPIQQDHVTNLFTSQVSTSPVFTRKTPVQNNRVENKSIMRDVGAQTNHSPEQTLNKRSDVQAETPRSTAPPVLTLHLKPSGDNSCNNEFVLSLQGATLISQKITSEQSQADSITEQKVSIPNKTGIVVIASQNPQGGLTVNRISNQDVNNIDSTNCHSMPITIAQNQHAPSQITKAEPSHSNPGSQIQQIPTFSNLNTQSKDGHRFIHNFDAAINQSQELNDTFNNVKKIQQPSHVFTSITSQAQNICDNSSTIIRSSSESYPQNFLCVKSSSKLSCDTSSNFIQTQADKSSCQSADAQAQVAPYQRQKPEYTKDAMEMSSDASTISQNSHPLSLMAGPSQVISSSGKDINNQDSCDTLDGSFSSLPASDLNLDDLLDLNEELPGLVLNSSIINLDKSTPAVSYQSSECKPVKESSAQITDICCQSSHGPCKHGVDTTASTSNTTSLADKFHTGPDEEINSVIRDFSPDWAYAKGHTKVLVAGPWCQENVVYACVFDGAAVPTVLLQPGLLRCFTPCHSVGYSTLQVARDGVVISNCEVFEFRDKDRQQTSLSQPDWFAFDVNQLKMLFVERLSEMCRCFQNIHTVSEDVLRGDTEAVEQALLDKVMTMTTEPWLTSAPYPKAGQHNLTLLHLAAALGYAKLISCLIHWRTENSCVALEFEVDALSVDSHACTPLMWACALGKIDAALTLTRWNSLPLKMCNKDGLVPLSLARQNGHYNLANQVEQLQRVKDAEEKKYQELSLDLSSSLMDAGLSQTVKAESESKEPLIPSNPAAFTKPKKPGPKLIRRLSEQVLGIHNRPLNKRNSVDILPSGQSIDQATLPSISSPQDSQPIRETTSDPQLPVSLDMAFVTSPAPKLPLEDKIDEPSAGFSGELTLSKMDTDEVMGMPCSSPIIDVERISSDDEDLEQNKDGSKHQMVTLANQIIAAIPERIKLSPSKGEDQDDASSGRGRSESHSSLTSQGSPRPSSFGDDSGISTPMTDSVAFDDYRYPEFGTPASSLSPDSTCLPSPYSPYSPYSFTLDSPPPTTAEFTEYFNAPTTYMEKDFSQLTLSDQEQRKLYEAAKVIQNAFRHYRDKQQQQQQQQQKEIEAAILIQSYYRRYKTYAYYKKMSHAAVLIQNQFRSYYAKRTSSRRESERLKKGRNQSVIIQQRFRSHYQRRSFEGKEGATPSTSTDGPESSPPQGEVSNCHDEKCTNVNNETREPASDPSNEETE